MINSEPLVSVIIPVFCHEKFIATTLDSIINQTYKNWELLVVDDCSTDKSWEIIQEYVKKDSRISAFRNEKNIGLVPNWKFLIDNSKGEYIAFLEGDDVFYDNNLKKKVDILLNNTRIKMVYSEMDIISENNEVIVKHYYKSKNRKFFKKEVVGPEKFLYSKHHITNSYSQILVRKKTLLHIGYPRSLDPSEKVFLPSDWDFSFRICTKNSIYFITEPLIGYRKHSNNNSYNTPKNYAHMQLLLNEYEKVYKSNKKVLKAIKYKRGRSLYSLIIFFLEGGDKKNLFSYLRIYFLNFPFNILRDYDLTIKLFLRICLPNKFNIHIKKNYYSPKNK
jgi:glycosyltransferase involved in cell wall biosynthesis